MLIPSIDLMGGKIVQLVQGKKKALEFDDFDTWVDRFSKYPLVQLIDLDAAIGSGDNTELVRELARKLPCQVGGGLRSVEAAQEALAAGAQRVILGSALFREEQAGYGICGTISCCCRCQPTRICARCDRRQSGDSRLAEGDRGDASRNGAGA